MKGEIKIVSIGQGNPDLLNVMTINTLREAERLILRTGNHPLTGWLDVNKIVYQTLDHLYGDAEDFDQLTHQIADEIIRNTGSCGVVYAVPDAYTDYSVKTLFRQVPEHIHITVVPGISSYDLHLSSALDHLPDASLQIVPAYDLISSFIYDPRSSLLITEIDNAILAGQIKIVLSDILEDEHNIFLIQESGRPVSLPLYMLDRQRLYNHFTAILIPGTDYLHREKYVLQDLTDIVSRLRAPNGCPWDRQQTHESLRPYLIEEAWECAAAIDENDPDHLGEELGDLLFQIVFHSSIGKDFDEFTIHDVITAVCRKMIRRHPHVFSADLPDLDNNAALWDKIKQSETGHHTLSENLDDISAFFPSLKYASKIIKKMFRSIKEDYSGSDIISEIRSLLQQRDCRDDTETPARLYGLLLLLCCALCCHSEVDSEWILHQTSDRLKECLKQAEKNIIMDGKSLESLTFSELCVYLKHVEGEIE
ncbi:MAG: MazG family protein [Clostridia bacterium]|nr:MazG family protein [Clostridia bacterium]